MAAPLDLGRFIAYGAALAQGVAVKVVASGTAGSPGRASLATATGADAVGITVSAAAEDAPVRIAFLSPGAVIKGTAAAELQIGDTCGFNSTLDGFDDGTGTTILVINTEPDSTGAHKIVYGILTDSALY